MLAYRFEVAALGELCQAVTKMTNPWNYEFLIKSEVVR